MSNPKQVVLITGASSGFGRLIAETLSRKGFEVFATIGEKHVNRNMFTLSQDDINGLVHHLLKDVKTNG